MFRNYLKVALRSLGKRKGFTFINILGLAIGIACCLLIAIYVSYEWSYDRYNANGDRIYRVTQKTKNTSETENGASTPFPVGPALQNDYPRQIATTVRLFDMEEDVRTIINTQTDESYRVDDFYVADSTFFDVFSANIVKGNPETALDKPMSAIITKAQARRFFGDEDPMGKQLEFKGVAKFTVTGVMKSLPHNSHFHLDMLVSMSSLPKLYHGDAFMKRWYWNPCWTYVLLKKGASAKKLEQQLPHFVDKNYTNRAEGEQISLSLQPLKNIHLYSHLDQEMEANGSIFYVYLFSAVAVLILIIACINFMNLSTARSTERAREVGMRKVLGADRSQLFGQFMGESFLMTLLGFIVALSMVYLALPWFGNFVGKPLQLNFFGNPQMILALVGLFVLVTFLAGFYPALYLSGFNPTTIMHGSKASGGGGGKFMRRGLVVFQFALSVMLIIGTVVVYLQLRHMQKKELGFDQERVVVMPITQTLIAWEFDKFKKKALASPNILNVTGTSKVLGSEHQYFSKYSPASQPDAPSTNMVLHVKHNFIDTYNIKLLAGRNFSKDHPTDADKSILINKAMLKEIHAETPREALGKTFYYTNVNDKQIAYQVIGVVDNFNYTSIKKKISPLVINLIKGTRPTVRNIEYAAVKLPPGGIQKGIADLRKVWKEVNHIDPFTYTFYDQKLQTIYAPEKKMSRVAGIFSVICIFVACLGLFGLASFTSSMRIKEIGIRKTLGATVSNIVGLLSKDYLKLVILANIVAWPGIYYLSSQWLHNFPYRIPLGWNIAAVFLAVGLGSILICMLTVSYQSIRAALINPIDSIRQE